MQLFENWHGKEEGRMQCVIYPHANDTCSPKLLRELKRISDHYKALVTVHFAQTTREVERLRNAYHQTPAEFLIDVGLFNERLSGAHCIFIEEGDIDLMAQYGVTFINNCVINNKRGAIPHTHIALQKGVNVGLGTDNMFGDIIETLRYAISNMRIDIPDFKIPTPYQALKMATINGAKALNRSQELGSLDVYKRQQFAEPRRMHFYYWWLFYYLEIPPRPAIRNRYTLPTDTCFFARSSLIVVKTRGPPPIALLLSRPVPAKHLSLIHI